MACGHNDPSIFLPGNNTSYRYIMLHYMLRLVFFMSIPEGTNIYNGLIKNISWSQHVNGTSFSTDGKRDGGYCHGT
jgi:hypothetical protein